MLASKKSPFLKTWIEIDQGALHENVRAFLSCIGTAKLFAVVKSNAYGHDLVLASKIFDEAGVFGFCVDSIVEGLTLRSEGMQKPILVLGPIFGKETYATAARKDIAVTISNIDAYREWENSSGKPVIHIKIDTGMRRQGFLPSDLPAFIRKIKDDKSEKYIEGAYTHFAFKTKRECIIQKKEFDEALALFENSDIQIPLRHAAATGGVLLGEDFFYDAVRVGAGLYSLCPSSSLQQEWQGMNLNPALSWQALVSEIKHIKNGDHIGYDGIFIAPKDMTIALIPIGYWHGYDRRFGNKGEALICGAKSKVLGMISMDCIVIDVTGINVKRGDIVTLLGKGKEGGEITAEEASGHIGTIPYELLTRLNPRMERRAVEK